MENEKLAYWYNLLEKAKSSTEIMNIEDLFAWSPIREELSIREIGDFIKKASARYDEEIQKERLKDQRKAWKERD